MEAASAAQERSSGSTLLAVLLAMAMFVLVVDTSLMNVSISAVVHDLDTTASGVQSAIALEALVSAAFILIGSKIGDLIGRKRAYILGLLGYAVGALSMTLSQSLLPIVIFWAIIGGLGASLLLPAMQSLIHGNFEGADAAAGLRARRRRGGDRRRGRAAARRLHHDVPLVARRVRRRGRDHRDRARRKQARPRRAVHGRPSESTSSARSSPRSAWAASCSGSSSGRRAARPLAALIAVGVVALGSLAWWLVRRKREGKPALIDVGLFESKYFRLGISSQTLQQIALGGLMIALPIFLQMVLEYNALEAGLSLAPLSLSMFAVALLAGRKLGGQQPEQDHPCRVPAARGGVADPDPDRAARRLGLGDGRAAPHRRRRARPARLAAQQLHAVADRGGARQRGGGRELRGRVVRALVRARLRRRDHARVAVARLHAPGRLEQGALAGRAGAGRQGAREERRGDDEHPPRGAARRASRPTSRPRSSTSTPRRGRSPFRSRCSSRSSPRCSASSTASG